MLDLITQQKLERREHILEAARTLIAQQGYDAITVRDLAAHCRVSVPTLYNQFGSKDELLAAAVEALFNGLLAGSRARKWQGHRRLVGLIGLCADEMVRLKDYNRALVRTFMSIRKTLPLQASLMKELSTEIERALEEMSARGQLAAWADASVLSQQIKGASMAAAAAWAVGGLDDEGLRASMLHAAAALVLGAARGAGRTALEREVRRAQSALAASLAVPPERKARGS